MWDNSQVSSRDKKNSPPSNSASRVSRTKDPFTAKNPSSLNTQIVGISDRFLDRKQSEKLAEEIVYAMTQEDDHDQVEKVLVKTTRKDVKPTSSKRLGETNSEKLRRSTVSDSSLLTLLEEERSRYNALDTVYRTLVSEVKNLQTAHLHQIKNLEKRNLDSSTANQTELATKIELIQSLRQDNKTLQEKVRDMSAGRDSDNLKIAFQVADFNSKLESEQNRNASLERVIGEMKKNRQELEGKLYQRESELKKIIEALRDKEFQVFKQNEIDAHHQLELIQIQNLLNKKTEDLENLKDQLRIRTTDADKSSRLHEALTNACAEIETLHKKLEAFKKDSKLWSQKEQKYLVQLQRNEEELKNLDMRLTRDDEKLRELNNLKISEVALKEEVATFEKQKSELFENLNKMEQQVTKVRKERESMNFQINELQKNISTLLKEQEMLRIQHELCQKELVSKNQDLAELKFEYSNTKEQLSEKIESELRHNHELQASIEEKDKIIEKLQEILKMRELQSGEILEKSVRRIDDLQNEKNNDNLRIQKLEASIKALHISHSRDIQDSDEKLKRSTEIASNELQKIRSQLSKASEEIVSLKQEIAQMNTTSTKREKIIFSLNAEISAKQDRIAQLENERLVKTEEIGVLSNKNFTLKDQMKLLLNQVKSLDNIGNSLSSISKFGSMSNVSIPHSITQNQLHNISPTISLNSIDKDTGSPFKMPRPSKSQQDDEVEPILRIIGMEDE